MLLVLSCPYLLFLLRILLFLPSFFHASFFASFVFSYLLSCSSFILFLTPLSSSKLPCSLPLSPTPPSLQQLCDNRYSVYNQYELVRDRTSAVTAGMLAYKAQVEVMSAALRVKITAAELAAYNFYYVRSVRFLVTCKAIYILWQYLIYQLFSLINDDHFMPWLTCLKRSISNFSLLLKARCCREFITMLWKLIPGSLTTRTFLSTTSFYRFRSFKFSLLL